MIFSIFSYQLEHKSNLKLVWEHMRALWFYELNVQKRFAKTSPLTWSNIFSYAISFRKFLQCARTLKNFLVASSNHLYVNISDKNIVWREKLLSFWVHLRLKSYFVLFSWMYKQSKAWNTCYTYSKVRTLFTFSFRLFNITCF